MRLPEEPDIPPQINIVPMIDVIFAILTFFIVSTLSLTRLQGLPVNLPKAATAKPQVAVGPITVTVDQRGNISLKHQSVTLDTLPAAIRTLMGTKTEALIIINADEQVTHGRVVAVMDRLRQINGVKLAIATEQP